MLGKRADLAIINRDFWPRNQVIGEALLCLAERSMLDSRVCVITQSSGNLQDKLSHARRGYGVKLHYCRSLTDSSSSLVMRAIDTVWFMTWCVVSLILSRPRCVYVSTNPPVVVPFIVFLYSKLFSARYFYHVQDIHPEAANIIVPINRLLFSMLKGMDCITLRRASGIMTLSDDMRRTIVERSATRSRITIVDNPAVFDESSIGSIRQGDVIFCGNAGRLQRIPLLLESIRFYYQRGGRMRFTFVGGGVYAAAIRELADELDGVSYLGVLPAAEASRLVSNHRWALLPIDDEVTRYAFPSKSSCYLVAGCKILAICSHHTSVAKWISDKSCGLIAEPQIDSIMMAFYTMEASIFVGDWNEKVEAHDVNFSECDISDYTVSQHVERLYSLMGLGSIHSGATHLDQNTI